MTVATLSRRSFEEYDRLLDSCETRSVRGFIEKVLPWAVGFWYAPNEETRSVYRDAIIDEVYGRIELYRAEAQVYADEMFEAMTGIEPAEHEPFPFEAADARVRSAATYLFEDGDLKAFIKALCTFITREVSAGADDAMADDGS